MVDAGHTVIPSVGVDPVTVEGNILPVAVSSALYCIQCCFVYSLFLLNRQTTRKRSGTLENRRARRSRESALIEEIRAIIGLESGTSKLETLNAGANIRSITVVVDLGIHRPFVLVIQKLGGTVPQLTSCDPSERMKLAYGWLHQHTGNQGRLKHVYCLELGKWNL